MPMRYVVLLCVGMLLGGCVNQLAQRQAMLNQFIGHSDTELVQHMGVPARSYETGGVRYLAYDDSKVALMPPIPPFSQPYWIYGWDGGALPPQAVVFKCETTFAVVDGLVRSYALRGNACG